MKLSELKNSGLFRNIIRALFDKKMEGQAYSLEHSSVKVEDYEPIIQMIRNHDPSYRGNFQPIRYWIEIFQNEIVLPFNDGNRSSNAEVSINIASGTIEMMSNY
jgi:hypothetical protein